MLHDVFVDKDRFWLVLTTRSIGFQVLFVCFFCYNPSSNSYLVGYSIHGFIYFILQSYQFINSLQFMLQGIKASALMTLVISILLTLRGDPHTCWTISAIVPYMHLKNFRCLQWDSKAWPLQSWCGARINLAMKPLRCEQIHLSATLHKQLWCAAHRLKNDINTFGHVLFCFL